MDDVEVDVLDAQPLQAALRLHLGVLRAGMELRRDEDLLARDAAVAQGPADALLVAVGLRRVDVAVAELERPPHRVLGLRPFGHLPHAKREEGNLVAIGEDACAPVRPSGSLPCQPGYDAANSEANASASGEPCLSSLTGIVREPGFLPCA